MEKSQNVGTKSAFTPKFYLLILERIFHFGTSQNTILVLTFLDHNQFGPYILVAINLILVIFIIESIWYLPLNH